MHAHSTCMHTLHVHACTTYACMYVQGYKSLIYFPNAIHDWWFGDVTECVTEATSLVGVSGTSHIKVTNTRDVFNLYKMVHKME